MTEQQPLFGLEQFKREIPVLDHGFVELIDTMGSDASIERAARVSYNGDGEVRKYRETRALLRYMMKHNHCYNAESEVLTSGGWKAWKDCHDVEELMVPDVASRSLKPEIVDIKQWEYCGKMVTVESNRVKMCVTPTHRVFMKRKYSNDYAIFEAAKMPAWGHFMPLLGFKQYEVNEASDLGRLCGMFLGDGAWNGNAMTFHLKKQRKISYLTDVLSRLGLDYTNRPSGTHADAVNIYVMANSVKESGVFKYLTPGEKARQKALKVIPSCPEDLLGVFEGLANSDGHVNTQRNGRIQYASSSETLLRQFCVIAQKLGYDARHMTFDAETGCRMAVATPPGRSSLEIRKQYIAEIDYAGKVYCATTSTGLLSVRGSSDTFGYVCGNSSPYEMAEIILHVKLPIFVERQWVRHRTASVNELSARYSELPEEYYVPELSQVCYQSTDNKQGRSGPLDVEEAGQFQDSCRFNARDAFDEYHNRLKLGIAKETARINLPLSTYTRKYWKMDASNLMHFMKLRLDPHAQWEISQYAEVIFRIFKAWLPITAEAFIDYKRDAATFSRMEISALKRVAATFTDSQAALMLESLIEDGCSLREIKQFTDTIGIRGLK